MKRGFVGDRRGSISLEFAIVVPVLLILFCGTVELTQLVRANLKLQSAVWTAANLVATQAAVDAAAMANACAGSQLVMTPFDATSLKVTVASVTVDTKTKAAGVDWQDTSCGGGATMANPVATAGTLVSQGGDSVIIVSASYVYTPVLSYVLPASFTLSDISYARPRGNKTIAYN